MSENKIAAERIELLLSADEQTQMLQIMNIQYAAFLKGRKFSLRAELEDGGVVAVQVVLSHASGTYSYPVCGRMQYQKENLDAKEAALFLIDYIDTYFDEFLREEENVFVPIDWTNFTCEGVTFQLRGQIVNPKMEALADSLLAEL